MRVALLAAALALSASAAWAQIGATFQWGPNVITVPAAPTDGGLAISAAQAPVQSVNKLTGAVTVQGIRASCAISTFDATGTGSCTYGGWSGGTAFTATPDCYPSVSVGNTSYVYALPIVTPGIASVSITEQAALKLLTINLGLTTIWGAPPAGTTITMFCRGS